MGNIVSYNILSSPSHVVKMILNGFENQIKETSNIDKTQYKKFVENFSMIESNRSHFRYSEIINFIKKWLETKNTIICLQEVNSKFLEKLKNEGFNFIQTIHDDMLFVPKETPKDECRVVIYPKTVSVIASGDFEVKTDTAQKNWLWVVFQENDSEKRTLVVNLHAYWKFDKQELTDIFISFYKFETNSLMVILRIN
jgi:hypothetical protein